ncbi:bacterial low temperature requirement A protein-domain-containing protein [Zalerion maritima]|uniref:Bacterial low temperature requirement A protein-domain-containing protein n=1 Tax=Zalerion maritima TaxID=339359 RepID=A0AAD5RVN2_9PEZI|nr:bacterial low temperature requirement A protein-domain-containing protein [Zalerion maritima]
MTSSGTAEHSPSFASASLRGSVTHSMPPNPRSHFTTPRAPAFRQAIIIRASMSGSNWDVMSTVAQNLLLPDGRRLLSCPETHVDQLRAHWNGRSSSKATPDGGSAHPAEAGVEEEKPRSQGDSSTDDPEIVVVVAHGSPDHVSHLRKARRAVEALLSGIGAPASSDESVNSSEYAITAKSGTGGNSQKALESNFKRFGFKADVRTIESGRPGGGATTTISRSAISKASWGSGEGAPPRCQPGNIRLWKRPVVRQYFHKGLLWRAEEETTVMSFELFFDLLYVGIIAINGDHVAEEADGHELLRFVATFGMSWKIWQDVAQLMSWFEVDDVLQRVEIVFLIACLLGFTTNMLHAFHSERDTYTQLVAFYLTARLFNAAYCLVTMLLVPAVKGMMVSQAIIIAIPSVLWIASIHVEMPQRLALVFIALSFDIFGSAVVIIMFRYSRTHPTRLAAKIDRFFEFYPAVNIEHKVERTNAFVTLVLGYSVVVVLYQNEGWGLDAFLGKAILGLIQAFVFNWIYFEIDGANISSHAIRRQVWTALLWQNAHIPYVMGYILGAAALSKLVLGTDCANAEEDTLTEFYRERSEPEIHDGLRYLYCSGLGIALLSTTLMSVSHRHRVPSQGDFHPELKPAVPKWARLANRAAISAVILCLPLAGEHLNSLHLVSTTTGLIVWVLIVELAGNMCWTTAGEARKGRGPLGYTARCSSKELEEAVRTPRTAGVAKEKVSGVNMVQC